MWYALFSSLSYKELYWSCLLFSRITFSRCSTKSTIRFLWRTYIMVWSWSCKVLVPLFKQLFESYGNIHILPVMGGKLVVLGLLGPSAAFIVEMSRPWYLASLFAFCHANILLFLIHMTPIQDSTLVISTGFLSLFSYYISPNNISMLIVCLSMTHTTNTYIYQVIQRNLAKKEEAHWRDTARKWHWQARCKYATALSIRRCIWLSAPARAHGFLSQVCWVVPYRPSRLLSLSFCLNCLTKNRPQVFQDNICSTKTVRKQALLDTTVNGAHKIGMMQ